ncbi:SF1B family DNA helicase RecD2 [Desulfuribacillus alkaliarsenatis]|uniref:ATP-dependent RecD2 DNA helicase n=1 Tax=Desulfuribacillus alkaliarsenatis TaxID=766136 RepID=A0A1E5G111_9FIRM|nr:ATP-dependent RecD-like DNA helicase [Desulfuribacillus alkaliarsenatis]OEF96583.1 recombinase RecD [Desulfuribacillus alkaliarsenatis]
MERLSGIVERITYQNEENGFCVLKIRSKGHVDLVTVVGNLASVNVGAVIQLRGLWKMDSKFGKQFACQDYEETVPATIAGIEKYLGSGLIKGIGPVYARKIVKHFKEDTLRMIEEQPDDLIHVEGIGQKRVNMIKKAWVEQKEIKNVMLFLQSNGVSTAYAVKIYKTYGNDAIDIVTTNPYRLADDIWGIGFKTADRIAQQMGYAKDSFERCRSGIVYVLNELSNDGHCFATREQLLEKSQEILEVERQRINETLEQIVIDRTVILEKSTATDNIMPLELLNSTEHTEDAIFLPSLYYSEVGTARRIKEISKTPSRYQDREVSTIISNIENEHQIRYDEVQRQAIQTAIQSKFMVLTGGPGTGKTTTTLAIIKAFENLGGKVLLAAPTGRAAKRMTETTGMEAKTIHRLLEFKPTEGYKKNEQDQLECDILIVDETSMVDVVLMFNLLKAVANETVVILVGDVDQLPSVGPGNVLKDIIVSETVNVVKLTRIFRQAQGSDIIMNAHRINNGEIPRLKTGHDSDFFFIEEEDPVRIAHTIKGLCTKRLPSYYQIDPINDIQVLCPMQRGDTGAVNLNIVLQQALNPSTVSISYGSTTYRLGDKVMQIKNNYDKNVFNGDIGTITHVDREERTLTITFDNIPVEYDVTELDEVMLSYATTVHKSQGSEYRIVIAPFTMQHYMMLQRNLIYTCITRAKKVIILVGTKKAISMAVRNNKTTNRNTRLTDRLQDNNNDC